MAQPDSSAVNLADLSSMAIVEGMDTLEVSSEALHFHPEQGINEVGEITLLSTQAVVKNLLNSCYM